MGMIVGVPIMMPVVVVSSSGSWVQCVNRYLLSWDPAVVVDRVSWVEAVHVDFESVSVLQVVSVVVRPAVVISDQYANDKVTLKYPTESVSTAMYSAQRTYLREYIPVGTVPYFLCTRT